jgi:hypothetical protein
MKRDARTRLQKRSKQSQAWGKEKPDDRSQSAKTRDPAGPDSLTMGADRILFAADYPYEDYDEAGDFIETVPIGEGDRRNRLR